MAGPHAAISLTRADPNHKSGTAAERGDSSIRDHNRKVVNILGSPTKPSPSGEDTGRVIYGSKK